jgi:exosortase D (VPLPA-CTERM-specific)
MPDIDDIQAEMAFPSKPLKVFPLVIGGLLTSAVVWFYWPVFVTLIEVMLRNEDTSYGLILPLVSGFIVYKKWPEIRQQPLRPSWSGLGVLAVGFGVYLLGELFQSLFIPSFSFLVVLAGLFVLVGGWPLVRLVAFPLALLVLMIPYEGFLVRKVTFPLQLVSSQLAAGLLKLMGYVVHLQGNIIDLGARQLNIVAACSGLRYVINLVTLGVIFCYFFQRRAWKVAIILASLVPYAIFANAVRIASIGVFPILEKGWWHTSIGLSIFLLGFDYLKLINWTLNRWEPAIPAPAAEMKATRPASPTSEVPSYTPYLITALILVLVAGPVVRGIAAAPPRPLLQAFDRFPMQLGPWEGRQSSIDPDIFKVTTADTYLNADFINPGHGSVNLWIAYYEDKRRGKNFHSPAVCLTGSGWQTVYSHISTISGRQVNYMLLEQRGERMVVYYWYIQGGQWVAGDYFSKLTTGIHLLFGRRSDGALIRITTPSGLDVEAARERLGAFASLLIPKLPQFISE